MLITKGQEIDPRRHSHQLLTCFRRLWVKNWWVEPHQERYAMSTLENPNSSFNINYTCLKVLYADTGLSFWGGVDPVTGFFNSK